MRCALQDTVHARHIEATSYTVTHDKKPARTRQNHLPASDFV